MKAENREEDLNVNIVLWSGIATGGDKGKQPEDNAWVLKALEKEVEFDLERASETFMEENKSFTEASTFGVHDKPVQEINPSMLTTYLETCMELLSDRKVVVTRKESTVRTQPTSLEA